MTIAKTREDVERERKAKAIIVRTTDRIKERSSHYSDEAMLKMVNLLYDPLTIELCEETGVKDEAQLLSLTLINSSREAYFWALQLAKEATFSINRTWPLSRVIRVAFLLARRSLQMKAFMLGVGLAQEQAITKTEEAGEETEW